MAAGLTVAFLLGALLFRLGGMGGGDVKLLAAVGAALGLPGFASALLYMSVAAGVLALVARVRKQREIAFVPAILAGTCLFFWIP